MDSEALRKIGFREWSPFQQGVEKMAPEVRGVYAFRSLTHVDLTVGSSDVMYFGRAMSCQKGPHHNLRHSLREYLHPGRTQRTKLRVGRKALAQRWEVSWIATSSPDQVECQMLGRFYEEHGQLPPENKIWPPGCGS